MRVYFSQVGRTTIYTEIDGNLLSLKEIINIINMKQEFVGIKNDILEEDKISSQARIFENVSVETSKLNGTDNIFYKFYEKEADLTKEIFDIESKITSENILISIFKTEFIINAIKDGLKGTKDKFEYLSTNKRKKYKDYKPMIDVSEDEHESIIVEDIYGFKKGETSLESLMIPRGENAKLVFKKEANLSNNLTKVYDKAKSKLIPEDLVSAIRDIWNLDEGKGTLRLFQEDSLFFILSKLMNESVPKEKELLLSMPTGGGKTEAFMIPILANIYQRKVNDKISGIQSVVMYPTKALANDQAMRFVELIYKVNQALQKNGVRRKNLITIGILTGDTPIYLSDMNISESPIQICPKCGKSNFKYDSQSKSLVCKNELQNGTLCDTRLEFCRLTKRDIIENPPDVLITNPDMLNVALHNVYYLQAFIQSKNISSVVFDEIHTYQGIFGCHISHLLRRFEELIERKPLYIGMSATIGNATELAALLFNEPLNNIKYIRNENGKYVTDDIVKTRYHVLLTPHLQEKTRKSNGDEKDRYTKTISVACIVGMFIAHLIPDSHFKKTIIFTNYRADADDIASYISERERFDVTNFCNTTLYNIFNGLPLSKEDVNICAYLYNWYRVIKNYSGNFVKNIHVGWNRGGLEKEDRIRSIQSFSRNNILTNNNEIPIDLMVATKSLEVGIDIGDVSTVINSSAPFSINEYVQRVGRAGRKKNSIAITVVNPENAIDSFLKKHFEEYAKPQEENFEDAPIIINNEIIFEKHIKARIIDFFTKELLENHSNAMKKKYLSVDDILSTIEIVKDSRVLKIGGNSSTKEVNEYSNRIYELIFEKEIENKKVIDILQEYSERESAIINTNKVEFDREKIKIWISEVINEIHEHTNDISNSKWLKDKRIVGRDSLMQNLTPNLRSSGAEVGLYVSSSNREEPVEIVTRQVAFNSMPTTLGKVSDGIVSTVKSGISTFVVTDKKGESNCISKRIKKLLMKSDKALAYFSKKIEDFPDTTNDDLLGKIEKIGYLNFVVPDALYVKYFPSRFYCRTCKRGLGPNEYSEKKDGIYCNICHQKVNQLHKVYRCEDPECGRIYEPPVPKMCINPDCSTVKRAFSLYVKKNNRFSKEIYDLFKFRLSNDMQWECQTCKTKIDFSSIRNFKSANIPLVSEKIDKIFFGKKTSLTPIEQFCQNGMKFPEKFQKEDQIKVIYGCKEPNHSQTRAISVPRVRTISYNYYIKNENQLCPKVKNRIVEINFSGGDLIQFANKFRRSFSTGFGEKRKNSLKEERIFNSNETFWSNTYQAHLGWFKFSEQLDNFIDKFDFSCDGDCENCKKFDSLDLGKTMKPVISLEDYQYDGVDSKPKRPDMRGKYCSLASSNKCTKQSCENCADFEKKKFLRLLIVHTLKHCILWAIPKYTGANLSEIKGEVYPNEGLESADIVLVDSNEGGAGILLLIEKNWEKIWKFVQEIVDLVCINKANIIISHGCQMNNSNLCPFLVKDFIQFLGDSNNDD